MPDQWTMRSELLSFLNKNRGQRRTEGFRVLFENLLKLKKTNPTLAEYCFANINHYVVSSFVRSRVSVDSLLETPSFEAKGIAFGEPVSFFHKGCGFTQGVVINGFEAMSRVRIPANQSNTKILVKCVICKSERIVPLFYFNKNKIRCRCKIKKNYLYVGKSQIGVWSWHFHSPYASKSGFKTEKEALDACNRYIIENKLNKKIQEWRGETSK